MSSLLLLLPPEITDLIFSTFTTHQSSQVRLLSKSHNARFHSHFRTIIFTRLRLNTYPSTLLHLSKITASGAGPWIQHITFSSKPFSKLNPTVLLSTVGDGDGAPRTGSKEERYTLTDILHHLPNLRSIGFDTTCNVSYWKEIIASISKSQASAVETLRSPPGKMLVSELELSSFEMERYHHGFSKLKTLEMHTAGVVTENLWSWISTVGKNNLEDLTIRNSRSSNNTTEPVPNAHDGFLPPNFELQNLKRLHLDDFNLTVRDITLLLSPTSQIEKINLSKCQIPKDQAQSWFAILTYLKQNTFPRLNNLKLTLSGYYNGITTYDLPDLKINNEMSGKPWNSRGTKCEVKLRSGAWNTYVVRKYLWEELERTAEGGLTAEEFWESLTNGKWTSKRATRLKRIMKIREVSRSEYGERGDPRLYAKIRAINREVDSDCEDVCY